MPMPIRTPEEYDEVLSATWFVDERSLNEVTYVSRFTWEDERLSVSLG